MINNVGHIRFGLLGNSWYYSFTRLNIEGTLEVDGKKESVKGVGWFDRQWGTWEWCGMGGWQWFALQLNDDIEILFMQITHPLTSQTLTQILNIVSPDSKVKVADGFKVKALGKWKSLSTGATYETGWILRSQSLAIEIRPLLEDQEMYPGMWEGSCIVEGHLDGHAVA